MRSEIARVVVYGALAALLLVCAGRYRYASQQARLVCCQNSLTLLASAAGMYAVDWDDRLPPRVAAGDWMARRWSAWPLQSGLHRGYHLSVAEPGPLWPYLKNACVNRCPSDPDNTRHTYAAGAHPSYEWNLSLAGQTLSQAAGKPLAWDDAPRHRHGRNVVSLPAAPGAPQAKWVPEASFAAARRR